jgi:methylthioribose-1-phosphate isomerase
MSGLQAIKYVRGRLEVLDQLKLPHEFVYDNVSSYEEGFHCIKSMRVRGIYRLPRCISMSFIFCG